MEGIDLAGVVDSDFQGIQINFAPPRRFCQLSRGGAGQDLLYAGRGSPFFRGAGRTSLLSSHFCDKQTECSSMYLLGFIRMDSTQVIFGILKILDKNIWMFFLPEL